MLHFYIDGSALNNGKANSSGGYGIAIFDDNNNLIDAYQSREQNTTNNRMQLMACLKSFQLLNNKYKGQKAKIYSDSAYTINILTSWIYKWSMNGWINSKKQIVKNFDLIQSLYEYYNINFFICQIEFVKVDGHCGIIGNEVADALASFNKGKLTALILQNKINLAIE